MKKMVLSGLAVAIVLVLAFIACKRGFNNSDPRGVNAGFLAECDPGSCVQHPCAIDEVRSGTDTLRGVISGVVTLDDTKTWILDGKLYIDSGAELIINPGTLVKAVHYSNPGLASAIVVTRNGTLIAFGTEECPIVFTSNRANPQPGDWGGIVLLGDAPVSESDPVIEGIPLGTVPAGVDVHYGGTSPHDNSGVLSYVRIEYAGVVLSADKELNGLTCGGVGDETILSYIQVYRGNDDAFQFFGGTVNADHLYAYRPYDDAFDFDLGYTGHLQFIASVLSNADHYSLTAYGINIMNLTEGESFFPTRPVISNATIIGVCDSLDSKRPNDLLSYAVYRGIVSSSVIRNSIFMGYPVGFRPEGTALSDTAYFRYNIVQAFDFPLRMSPSPGTFTLNTVKTFRTLHANDSIKLVFPCNYSCPDFRLLAGSPATSGAVFNSWPLASDDDYFVPVSYRGAFAACNMVGANWLAGWTKH